jgi:hypothetical protein
MITAHSPSHPQNEYEVPRTKLKLPETEHHGQIPKNMIKICTLFQHSIFYEKKLPFTLTYRKEISENVRWKIPYGDYSDQLQKIYIKLTGLV